MIRNHLLQTRDNGLKPHRRSLSILVYSGSLKLTVDDRVSCFRPRTHIKFTLVAQRDSLDEHQNRKEDRRQNKLNFKRVPTAGGEQKVFFLLIQSVVIFPTRSQS